MQGLAVDRCGENQMSMKITTKRFLLREFIDEDGPAFLAYQSDPRYAQFCAPEEVGADHARELLRHFREWAAEWPRRNSQLAISDIRNSQELLGCCGIRCDGYGSDQAEIGIELAPRYWGRYAYAIEIASALIDFGFTKLGLSEVRGVTISANSRVARLAHRYGFVAVGRRPGPEWTRARGWHQIEWQLTRKRWEVIQLCVSTRMTSLPRPYVVQSTMPRDSGAASA
jgi:[ribosomal protein S5]-alanine N-acetyltransferase